MTSLFKAVPILLAMMGSAAMAENPWENVPDPAPLPAAILAGNASINGETLYFETHGSKGPWIIFLHGGMGSVASWGGQVPAFAAMNRVLLIESRAHGKSSWDGTPLHYERMADDVVAIMDALGIDKAPLVGWSDGGNVALIMGIKYPDRVEKIVASGANADPEGIDIPALSTLPYSAPTDREMNVYKSRSPTPERWEDFSAAIYKMWETEPHITGDLGKISAPTLIMAGDHDVIRPDHTRMMAESIPGAKEVIVPDTSHFLMWQVPDTFNQIVKDFLEVK
jgi:pimeloyl-ACP methyl ester carboxylesterase